MIFTYSAAFYSFVLCSYLLSSCPLAGWLACLLVLFVVRGISKNYSILHNCSSCRIETAQAQRQPQCIGRVALKLHLK